MANDQNHIHLFGDPLENFYILGKKDKSSFDETYQHLSRLCTRNKALAKVLKASTEFSSQLNKRPTTQFHQQLEAYSQGLSRPLNDILFTMLLPEMATSLSKWIPNLISLIPGCSSLFYQCPQSKEVIHGRILDYALSGTFEKHERSILYEFKEQQKVFSYTTSGMPFPSLSAMNESGLSLALHYKYGHFFQLKGHSIFEITQKVIHSCCNIREAIKLIKKHSSISSWGIYLADSNGEVAAIDISGSEVHQEKFDLQDHHYIYFNNSPLIKNKESIKSQPYGTLNQCQMRRDTLNSHLDTSKMVDSKDPLIDLVKTLGQVKGQKSKSAQNWLLSPINPGSVQLVGFNNTKSRSISIPGIAPKFFHHEYYLYQNIFEKIQFKHIQQRKNKPIGPFFKAYQSLTQYQSALDRGDVPRAYHCIQMALPLFKGYPEYFMAKFFYTVTQYIYEVDKRDYTYIFDDFKGLEGKLPEYLEDHLKLFLMRTGKIIGHKDFCTPHEIKHKKLRELYHHEKKLSPLAIKGFKHLIFIRVEILDIIYSYY